MRFYIAVMLGIAGAAFMKVGRNLMQRRAHFDIDISGRPIVRELHGAPAAALGKGLFFIGLAFMCGLLPVLLWRDEMIFSAPALACFIMGLVHATRFRKLLLEADSTDDHSDDRPLPSNRTSGR